LTGSAGQCARPDPHLPRRSRLAADHLPPLRPDLPARGRTGAAHTGRLPHLREPEIRPQQGPGLRGDLGRRGRTAGGVRRQPLPDRAPRTDRAAGRLRSARGHRGGDAPRGRSLHGQHRRGPRPGGAPPARGGAPGGGRRRGHRRSCHPDRDPAPDQLGDDPAAHRLLTRPHLESDGSTMRRRTMTTALTAALTTSVVSFDGTSGFGSIWESTDDGATFSQISTVLDEATETGEGLCCATLFELPRAVGDLPEGTLLWSASVGQDEGEDRRMSIRIWASTDVGRSWERIAITAVAENEGGLWEPEFAVADDGELVLWFSDETDGENHYQRIVQQTSTDALTWTDPVPIIEL